MIIYCNAMYKYLANNAKSGILLKNVPARVLQSPKSWRPHS
jgi:hypothetical protein